MPIYLDWENPEHTIVRMEFVGRWNWAEAHERANDGYAMLETVDHIVNVIIDMSRSQGLPLLALTHARNMIPKRHPRTGLTVFVGVSSLFLSLWKTFSSAFSDSARTQEFTFAASIEEAYTFFEQNAKGTIHPA